MGKKPTLVSIPLFLNQKNMGVCVIFFFGRMFNGGMKNKKEFVEKNITDTHTLTHTHTDIHTHTDTHTHTLTHTH